MSDLTLRYLLFGEDRTASKTVKGVGDAAESTASRVSGAVSRMGGAIGGDMGTILGRVSDGLEAAGGKADTSAKKLGAVGGVALATGLALQQMASGDVEAQNKLENAVTNTGKAYDDYADRVSGAVESSVRFGVTDGEVKDALTRLTDATKDPAKALDDLAMAQDLAAAKGVSLSDAATMIGKAHNGSAKVFKEFGIEVGKNADGTADYEGALGNLADTLKGRAEANADSFGGKMREIRAWTDNAASSLAEQYGPAITMAGAALTGLAAITEIASAANVKNAASTVAAKAAQIGSAVATGVATAAQWAWNVALNANPIGLIIIAIAAFVGAILWLWNNVDWFRNGVTAAWEAIKTGWTWLWDNAIKPGIDAFGAAFRWLWNSVLAPVTRFILDGFANLTDGIASFLDALSNIPGFEWAGDAADKMRAAATQARTLGSNLNDIPDNVPVTISMSIVGVQAVKNAINGIGGSMSAQLNARLQFASGGYTGNIPQSDIAGVVHGQEFVMDAAATRRLGVPFLEALQSGRTVDAPRGFTTASTHVGPSAESIGDAVASRLDGLAIRITNIDAITRAGHAQLVTAMGRA
ncbi:MAG: hypothetical protein IPI13_18125 [Actinomycetales bacterium]|uniref:Bacteriophage tail tape measure N-terminal domain-containing protein n=1 Tax=Candidatus Phosphoribacter hodrii TaxID=2953743 RepID=A0A935IYH2_9MICO|nr:hypothetical protein [Candidatus Phosphoribacter hodrii]HBY23239.1 hypothetical protein [Propionibacteriaceae bacterium]